jgi:putative hydrolase of the HAD superfamily
VGHIMASTIIFDGDDTLWELQPLYDHAMDAFARLLSRELGTSPAIVRDELLRIDVSHVNESGFGEPRFRHSMLTLYERLCFKLGRPAAADTKAKILNIAATVSTVFPRPMDGAREVLEDLCVQYYLILYSGGTRKIQVQKLKNLGFDGFFKGTYFCDTKAIGDLKKIVLENHLIPETTWMVGNSPKSDVNPALSLGLNCIWIRSASWAYDEEEFSNRKVHRIASLREIPGILSASKQR